ncbi:MAG: tRNA 2-thiocytidine biosynthesis TtcA family protein [Pseudomonadota bacterium]
MKKLEPAPTPPPRREVAVCGGDASFDPRRQAATRRVNRLVGQAICRYGLIEDSDHIAVGLSGGKDSLCLLWLLAQRRRWIPVNYRLTAIYVDLGFSAGLAEKNAGRLEAFCAALGVEFLALGTDVGARAHGSGNKESPCFICSRRRRQILFETALSRGCNRLALGHHLDDIIETFFLNVIYAAEISTMLPAQDLFGGSLRIIRPLALCGEAQLGRMAQDLDLPVVASGCPSACNSARRGISTMLAPLFGRNGRLKGNVFRALSNVRLDYLPAAARRGLPPAE